MFPTCFYYLDNSKFKIWQFNIKREIRLKHLSCNKMSCGKQTKVHIALYKVTYSNIVLVKTI